MASGFAAAIIELPGSRERPPLADTEPDRADLHRALTAGHPVDDIVDRLILPLVVEKAVPKWQSTLEALLSLPRSAARSGIRAG
ncbi:hypothetical protein MPSYJ_48640 [Mycolicibacterium psychrotolerans]|uniref:Uncharacterized protein n=1 Tax=Mycolicibacterium psychrotolerans TaxID=216929 RepID=A0A7I7MIP2_9MYCO|nr:hypothetical protein MPSYJ_48640 [Mycolicibacterium psychrotolerans]